jgi:light-regulated signal transduction histidine kinase (bacteriophytochrome)
MRELALHVLDLLQNAAEAGATRVTLLVNEDWPVDRLTIIVDDNGRGMAPETIARVTDPFFTTRTTRHVGLGLPLLAASAERSGGALAIRSRTGAGSTVEATFRLSHPDRQPLGDLASSLLAFLLGERAPGLHHRHEVIRHGGCSPIKFEFDTAAIAAELGTVPLNHPAVQRWLAEFLAEGEAQCQVVS